MKSVLISIQPKWCELIAFGKKTVEVRKTRPKIDTPFKCYIYCTQGKTLNDILTFAEYENGEYMGDYYANGKVIGEFVCDDINITDVVYEPNEVGWYVNNMYALKGSGLAEHDVLCYCHKETTIYGWHISDLVIYDKPKELSDFFHYCGENPDCDGCEARYHSSSENGTEDYCCSVINGCRPLKRPPQSWCYVEELRKEDEGK